MKNKTVKVQRLYLQVAEQLMALVESGEVKEGERLPSERDLTALLSVSRPTIREAMIALEIAGVVEIRSGSGVYVLPASSAQKPIVLDQGPGPFEILEARRLIESELCALAAERINEAQLAELANLLLAMEQENKQQHITEQADAQFHLCIAAAAGNSAISATISWLWDLRNDSEISTRFHQRVRAEGSKPIIADHRAILSALQNRNANAAKQAMNDHLQRVIDDLVGHL